MLVIVWPTASAAELPDGNRRICTLPGRDSRVGEELGGRRCHEVLQ